MFNDVVIVAAGRTAVGAFGGALAGIPASELGARVIKVERQDGDWQRNRVERTLPELIKDKAGRATGLAMSNGGISRNHMSELMDVESGGIVRMAERDVQFAKKFYGDNFVKNGFQLYGPVYVPPRGMRLLLGEGLVELPHGVAGRVQVTAGVRERLGAAFRFEPRGSIEVKGKGEMKAWFLVGRG